MVRVTAARARARALPFSLRHSGTLAKAMAMRATTTKPMTGSAVTSCPFLGLCTYFEPAPRSCRGGSDGQASEARPCGRATQQKTIRGSFSPSILVSHQSHDHAADGAHLLIGEAGTHYHGPDVAHHGFPLGGREKELGRVQLALQMLEQAGELKAAGRLGKGGAGTHGR